jgi:WD40 repeat protein
MFNHLRCPGDSAHMKPRRFLLLFALCTAGVSAQSITYNGFDFSSGQPVSTLRDMSPSGANDRAIDTILTEPGFPAWSRDGSTLALSSPDPLRPNKISRDIYLMDAATTLVRKIHTFEDFADAQGFHTLLPVAKAFSPDGRRLAATVFLQTGVVNSGTSTLPLLYLFDTSGLEPPVVLAPASLQDEVTLGGMGCDWSSTNQIAWPGSCGTPYFYNGTLSTTTNGTCIYILQPNVNAPQARQLTFPTVRADGNAFVMQQKAQVDYAPAFSPNGNFVAYVRATRTKEIPLNFPPDQCSIRVVNINGTGDTEILRLNPGFWISQMSWSPDGNQLVFDMGPQQIINGQPVALPVANAVEIHSLNMNTLTPSPLHAAPAAWPAWRPGVTTPPVALPKLDLRLVPGSNDIELTWPVGTAPFQLQSSPDLNGTWGNVNTAPVTTGGINKVTLSRNAPRMFFRLKGQ